MSDREPAFKIDLLDLSPDERVDEIMLQVVPALMCASRWSPLAPSRS